MKPNNDMKDWMVLLFIILTLAFLGLFAGDDMSCPDGYWVNTGHVTSDWVCP